MATSTIIGIVGMMMALCTQLPKSVDTFRKTVSKNNLMRLIV